MNLKSLTYFAASLFVILPPLSSAQTADIQVVGNLDASVVVGKVSGQDATGRFMSGFRHGSSIGLIGKEDLGKGLQVGFFLDQGFSLMNGSVTDGDTSNDAFSREAMLYLRGNLGILGFGRFGTLSSGTGSFTMLTGWVFGTTYTTAAWSEFGKTIPQYRLNNAVSYLSPNLNGLTIGLTYSNGTPSDDNRWSLNSRYYGAAFKYQNASLLSSLVLETADHKHPDYVGNRGRQYNINYGLEVTMESVTAMLAYQFNAQENGIHDHILGVSARTRLKSGDLLFGVRGLSGHDEEVKSGTDKREAWSVNAAYEYPLSKRTTLWAYGGYADGNKLLSTRYEAGRTPNFNGWQTAAGLTHKF